MGSDASMTGDQMGAAPTEAADQGGFVVCIAAQADGSYQVYAQDSDTEPGEDQTQTAGSVDEALDMARQLIEQEQGEDSEPSGDGNAPVADAQAVWDQMAAKRDKAKAQQGM